jgi:hypothetical protein
LFHDTSAVLNHSLLPALVAAYIIVTDNLDVTAHRYDDRILGELVHVMVSYAIEVPAWLYAAANAAVRANGGSAYVVGSKCASALQLFMTPVNKKDLTPSQRQQRKLAIGDLMQVVENSGDLYMHARTLALSLTARARIAFACPQSSPVAAARDGARFGYDTDGVCVRNAPSATRMSILPTQDLQINRNADVEQYMQRVSTGEFGPVSEQHSLHIVGGDAQLSMAVFRLRDRQALAMLTKAPQVGLWHGHWRIVRCTFVVSAHAFCFYLSNARSSILFTRRFAQRIGHALGTTATSDAKRQIVPTRRGLAGGVRVCDGALCQHIFSRA